jgi:hypothetical protein
MLLGDTNSTLLEVQVSLINKAFVLLMDNPLLVMNVNETSAYKNV